MNKNLLIGLIVVVVVAGGLWWMNMDEAAVAPGNESAQGTPSGASPAANDPAPATSGKVVTINMIGKPFSFEPGEIRVSKGDTVRILFRNEGGTHDWVLDEFNARTPILPAGGTATVEFVADKTGTFEYYCSVGNHREMGMKGTLIVN